jgi:hypothetical protein
MQIDVAGVSEAAPDIDWGRRRLCQVPPIEISFLISVGIFVGTVWIDTDISAGHGIAETLVFTGFYSHGHVWLCC